MAPTPSSPAITPQLWNLLFFFFKVSRFQITCYLATASWVQDGSQRCFIAMSTLLHFSVLVWERRDHCSVPVYRGGVCSVHFSCNSVETTAGRLMQTHSFTYRITLGCLHMFFASAAVSMSGGPCELSYHIIAPWKVLHTSWAALHHENTLPHCAGHSFFIASALPFL